jgi:hypothetical protein
MNLIAAMEAKEVSIIKRLSVAQLGIHDRTGKGTGAEWIIEEELLRPRLPRNFDICKDAVISSDKLEQSPAIDRIIYDTSISGPLAYHPDHSIFPLETVCCLVEITLRMNKRKLESDIDHIGKVTNQYVTKNFLIPESHATTRVKSFKSAEMTPRAFIIGLPESKKWGIKTIGEILHDSQKRIGERIHIHGLYVLGIGFFETTPRENESDLKYEIRVFTGKDSEHEHMKNVNVDLNKANALLSDELATVKTQLADLIKLNGTPKVTE